MRHANYVQRCELTADEQERFDHEMLQAWKRLGRDSPLVRSEAYQAGIRARIVRDRSESVTPQSRLDEPTAREEARP